MMLDLTLTKNKDGKINNAVSFYDPDQATKDRLQEIRAWFQLAYTIRNKPYRQFNDLSLVDRMNLDQMSFGQYVPPPSMDPAEAWRSQAFRPIVRNQIIRIAAHVTAAIIEPVVTAQNSSQEEDRDAAQVMRDAMQWANRRSGYDQAFISSVIGACVNPASFIYTENTRRFRTKRTRKGDRIVAEKELDDNLSGLKDYVVPCDEVWPTDIFENDIQKQPVVIWRKVVDYSDAKARYQGNEAFDTYVRPGLQLVQGDDALFYEVYDRDLEQRLVEELIVWVPSEGLRLTMVNGILCCDPDEPNPREDGLVPLAKFVYEQIDDGHFFYGKSLAFKLCNDEAIVNTAYRMLEDGSYLLAMPPAVAFGVDAVGSPVMIPGAVTTFDNAQNPQASFQTLATNNNLSALYNLIDKAESSIAESGSPTISGGEAPKGAETAYEISRLEQNARTVLGLFGKMIGFAVEELGKLKMNDILQHVTVAQLSELTGELSYAKLLLQDGDKAKRIEFVSPDDWMKDGSKETVMGESRKIRRAELATNDKTTILKVNPTLFRKLKFMVKADASAVIPESPAMKKALMLEEYALLVNNPYVDQEATTRDLALGAYDRTARDPAKYMKKPAMGPQAAMAGATGGKGVTDQAAIPEPDTAQVLNNL